MEAEGDYDPFCFHPLSTCCKGTTWEGRKDRGRKSKGREEKGGTVWIGIGAVVGGPLRKPGRRDISMKLEMSDVD